MAPDAKFAHIDTLVQTFLEQDLFGTQVDWEWDNRVPRLTGSFWTARQRQGHSLHEISYRACFKPQLPEFFIERLTEAGDLVSDPFMGRGTSLVQAALMGRRCAGLDVDPLAHALTAPRLNPPEFEEISACLTSLMTLANADPRRHTIEHEELLVFFHTDTLREIEALRRLFLERNSTTQGPEQSLTRAEAFLRLVAMNRLTGHSPGFFSVYSLPPNQAVSVERQRKINEQRGQVPEYRSVRDLILRKTRSLLRDPIPVAMRQVAAMGPPHLHAGDARDPWDTPPVDLTVTSPPFLNMVDYRGDNWLRAWFLGIDPTNRPTLNTSSLSRWQAFICQSLKRIKERTRPAGFVAFEVGTAANHPLEDIVLNAGLDAGLEPLAVFINLQNFTKTSNIWGVDNNRVGTNDNRITLFRC